MNQVFIDSSAFVALYLQDDDFHKKAVGVLKKLQQEQRELVTSNFILDEVYTFIRAKRGKMVAVDFTHFLAENVDVVRVNRITIQDEQKALYYFSSLDGKGVSFTDCTSFALMKRMGIQEALTFDSDFKKAGFTILT